MSRIITAAREELAALEIQLAPKLDYMAQLRALIDAHEALPKTSSRTRPAKRPVRRSGKVVAQTETASAEALKAAGHPLRLGDLVKAVRARGVPIGGKNPVATLRARLEHSDVFQTDRRRGVWLRDTDWPAEDANGESGSRSSGD